MAKAPVEKTPKEEPKPTHQVKYKTSDSHLVQVMDVTAANHEDAAAQLYKRHPGARLVVIADY